MTSKRIFLTIFLSPAFDAFKFVYESRERVEFRLELEFKDKNGAVGILLFPGILCLMLD